MTSQEKVLQLKHIIYRTLSPLIDSDYILLDLPYHSNLGDTLIWQGELDFLKTKTYKCRYSTWFGGNILNIQKKIHPETILLFHGGGNFGDLWPEPHEFRKKVLRYYPRQKTILLPQTIYYQNRENLLEDADFYSHYPNVTICARDYRSFDILKQYFPNNPSILMPDMAFAINIKHYRREKSHNGSIFIRRNDKEFNNNINYQSIPKDSYVSDWLFLGNSKKYNRQQNIEKWGARIDKRLGTDYKHIWLDAYWYYVLRPLNVKTAIRTVDRYKSIYTTRLHAAILSIILGGKNITLFDNIYGKSSTFYKTWLSDLNDMHMV